MTKPEIFPDSLLGKLVIVKYHHGKERINRDALLKGGRVLKIHQDGNQILVLNPECESLDDMVGPNTPRIVHVFKWASWVELSEASIEEVKSVEDQVQELWRPT